MEGKQRRVELTKTMEAALCDYTARLPAIRQGRDDIAQPKDAGAVRDAVRAWLTVLANRERSAVHDEMVDYVKSILTVPKQYNLIAELPGFGDLQKRDKQRKKAKRRSEGKGKGNTPFDNASEFRTLLDNSDPQMRAMVLLGINGAMGNSDVATLEFTHLDLDAGWLPYKSA